LFTKEEEEEEEEEEEKEPNKPKLSTDNANSTQHRTHAPR